MVVVVVVITMVATLRRVFRLFHTRGAMPVITMGFTGS